MARTQTVLIQIDGAQALRSSLSPKKSIAAIVYSLNRALTTARKQVSDTVRQEYALKAGDIKNVIYPARADRRRLMASVWIGQRKRFGSNYFNSRETAKGVTARITKSGRTLFKDAFIWERHRKKIVRLILQRKGRESRPLQEPVRMMNIRLASIVRPHANTIKRDFYMNFERILKREILRRSGNL